MKKKDLVALVWGSNTCCTQVVNIESVSKKEVIDPEDGPWTWPELEINLEKGTWKHGKKRGEIGRHFDGISEIWSNSRYGLIGIYDRTNMNHLGAMVNDGQEAVGGPSKMIASVEERINTLKEAYINGSGVVLIPGWK